VPHLPRGDRRRGDERGTRDCATVGGAVDATEFKARMTANARKPRRARWLVVGAWLMAGAARAPARTFSDILGTEILRPVGRALGESIGRALPVVSASPGVVYTFDPETGAFERETTVLGQLFLERPEPVGRRKWNLSL